MVRVRVLSQHLCFLFAFGNIFNALLSSRACFLEATTSPPSDRYLEPSSSVDMMHLDEGVGRERERERIRKGGKTGQTGTRQNMHTAQE
jgi:hypothetical protein